jgi:hypothetical protein
MLSLVPAVIVLVLALTFAPLAAAQKNCKKGIPCGNSCISATKVCRIGSAPSTPEPMPATSAEASTARSFAAQISAGDSAPATEFPWIGSFADGVYFQATCPAALDLAPTNRRYFRTHQDAEGAGYRRSRTTGC